MRRFSRDDVGYIDWLAAHPDGYVLNTYAHVTSSYLILHRASCRTVNRPLAPGRSWTFAYGKACSDNRAEIEAWALRETGKQVSPCGHCMPEHAGPGIAVITKVLYIKRPRLIPVLDSLVLAQVGAHATKNVSSWVAALEGVRATGQANRAALLGIREHVRAKGIADRSLARILDALLWAGSPGSGLFPSLTGWERIMRRHVADTD